MGYTRIMSGKITTASARHYLWGEGRNNDGWHFLDRPDLSIILERISPGAAEARHYHHKARQFFFVIEGVATFELGADAHTLAAREGIEVPPGVPHHIRNDGDVDLRFVLVSHPHAQADRQNC